jgi:hypothetical protein
MATESDTQAYEAMPDLRNQLPPGLMLKLDPDDKVIEIEDHSEDVAPPAVMPDPERMICLLGGVDDPKDLGTKFINASGLLPGREKGKGQQKFAVPFPRDFCYMMFALKKRYPFLPARGILQINKYIAMGDSLYRAAQYGRDAHEVRDLATDEIAQKLHKEQHWDFPYHGQIDVAGLALRLSHWVCFEGPEGPDFLKQTYEGEDRRTYTVLDSLIFRGDWIMRRLLSNRDGIIEFLAEFDGSHRVQSMEDSRVSHLRKNGEQADLTKGTSSTECLADTYEGLICLAEIFEYEHQHHDRVDLGNRAAELRRAAARLKQQIMKLWIEDEKYFAMGFDRDEHGHLRLLDAFKAIPAFILDTRIFGKGPEDSRIVKEYVRRLFKPDLFSTAGFRTLSMDHPWFNAGRYQLGAIWQFMDFRIAEGLRRQGMPHLARVIYKIIVRAFEAFKAWPELNRGEPDGSFKLSTHKVKVYNRRLGFADTINSIAQLLQAWSVSADLASREELKEVLPPITPFEEEIMKSYHL